MLIHGGSILVSVTDFSDGRQAVQKAIQGERERRACFAGSTYPRLEISKRME
jgi:hypothetical protein